MTRTRLAIALGTLISLLATGAVPILGTAHFYWQRDRTPARKPSSAQPLAAISLREVKNRGLLVNAWINGSGPYVLAVDTGAGLSMLSQTIANRLNLPLRAFKGDISGGLSSTPIRASQEATISQLALGTSSNVVPAQVQVIVATNLPAGLDGVLDPTEALRPLAYTVDLPGHTLETFDSSSHRLSISDTPPGGAVVRWVRERGDHRPYVRLGDGRLALLDTGSGFGLAVTDARSGGMNHGRNNRTVRDLGGGTVSSQRISPTTVSIGALVLRGVPTDLVSGTASDTPVILGRDALYPFKITFDPTAQLIAIEPSTRQ
jgi:predicted aspartyl protease